jgi:leader peptidase (prepilin peptidase)/N-methyltransferase
MIVLAALVGLILGSFANVIIYRLPRGESIVWPRSRCPSCRTPIAPLDNMPILSFLVLRGRCRHCRARISWRYPLVEGLTGALAGAIWWTMPDLLSRISALVFAFLLVAITFIDLDVQLIPNRLTYPGIVFGLVLAAFQGRAVPALLSAAGAAALITAIIVASRGGMGGGDVKLAAMMGAYLAWPGIAVGLFSGFIIGGIVGITLLAFRLRGRKDAIAFGPSLAAGALVALFWGDAVARWYWP